MKKEIAGVQYYSTTFVLAEVGISRQTLWRWRREELIPQGHRFRNGQLLFTHSEYQKILEHANRVEPSGFGSTPVDTLELTGGIKG